MSGLPENGETVMRATPGGFSTDPGFRGAVRTHSQLAAAADPERAALALLREARDRVRSLRAK